MGPATRRGSSPALLPTQDQSWPPNDFDPRSAGRGVQAVEAAVSYLKKTVSCFRRRMESPCLGPRCSRLNSTRPFHERNQGALRSIPYATVVPRP